MTYILIVILTLPSGSTSTTTLQVEFNSASACKSAGTQLNNNLYKRGQYVLTWGCFEKRLKE